MKVFAWKETFILFFREAVISYEIFALLIFINKMGAKYVSFLNVPVH